MANNAKAQAKTNPIIDHTRALQTLLKTDPHLAKLCADGFGIPGVKLVAFITGKDYLNRAFPQATKAGQQLQPFTAMKHTNGHLLMVTQP